MIEEFFWPSQIRAMKETLRIDGTLNEMTVRNINRRISKEVFNALFATGFLAIVLLFTPVPIGYVAGIFLVVALGLIFAGYRQVQTFFNEYVIPITQGVSVIGTLEMIEKHTTTGYAHNGWVIRYSFENSGNRYCFTKRLWAKEDASSAYKAGQEIRVFFMPNNPRYSIPSFSEINNNYNLNRGE